MSGIRGSKLYSYLVNRKALHNLTAIEDRVEKVYRARGLTFSSTYTIWPDLIMWVGNEATIEDLEIEFNSHELIELLQEEVVHP